MKKLILSTLITLFALTTFAQNYTYVSGYTKSNGTYVQGHYRTLPNNTRDDNWSTIGNINPFTGAAGTKPGDSYYSSTFSYATPSYSTSSNSLLSYPDYSNSLYSSNLSSYSYSLPTISYPSYSSYSTYSTPSSYNTYTSPITYSNNIFSSSSIYSAPINISNYTGYRY
jgi:hypothetical protein